MAKRTSGGKTANLVRELVQPICQELGVELWDVLYLKEGSDWFLRVVIDRPEGIDLNTCEAVSRRVSDLLDEADPIEGSYTLEVGSAGAERALKRPSDFQQFLGSPVLVKLYRAREGRKEFAGYLKGYDEATGDVTVTLGSQDLVFPKKETALIRLRVEF